MSPYKVIRHTPGPDNPSAYLIKDTRTGQFLGGFGSNFYRSWVFPLLTPSGQCVIQEFPYDHPFHNGLFVAQYPVVMENKEGNFWTMPPRRSPTDATYKSIGRMDPQGEPTIECLEDRVVLTLQSLWRDENEVPLLKEIRRVEFRSGQSATVCTMTSIKVADFGSIHFPATKYGAIGARVAPRLLPSCGGVISGDNNRRGSSTIFESERNSSYVIFESERSNARSHGLALLPGRGTPNGPWFVRDYGLAMLNPTMEATITLAPKESWSIGIQAIAFDGEWSSLSHQQE